MLTWIDRSQKNYSYLKQTPHSKATYNMSNIIYPFFWWEFGYSTQTLVPFSLIILTEFSINIISYKQHMSTDLLSNIFTISADVPASVTSFTLQAPKFSNILSKRFSGWKAVWLVLHLIHHIFSLKTCLLFRQVDLNM